MRPGTVVTSPRGTRVEVLENSPARFEIRRTMPPGTGKGPSHRHLDGAERFAVIEGEAIGSVGRDRRLLTPGAVLDVPIGVSHVHPHTAADATATILHTIEPRPRFAELFFASWLHWLEAGVTNDQDEPTLLQIMAIIKDGGGGTWVDGPPVVIQQALARVLGRAAGMRGFRPELA
jgi:mannose-6-phosphate isomerase-like protein (cupin superfamily)